MHQVLYSKVLKVFCREKAESLQPYSLFAGGGKELSGRCLLRWAVGIQEVVEQLRDDCRGDCFGTHQALGCTPSLTLSTLHPTLRDNSMEHLLGLQGERVSLHYATTLLSC